MVGLGLMGHGIAQTAAEKGFDVAVRGEYAKLYGDCRAAIPDVLWLHTMLTESDRNCEAALGVLASAYLTAPQNWPVSYTHLTLPTKA